MGSPGSGISPFLSSLEKVAWMVGAGLVVAKLESLPKSSAEGRRLAPPQASEGWEWGSCGSLPAMGPLCSLVSSLCMARERVGTWTLGPSGRVLASVEPGHRFAVELGFHGSWSDAISGCVGL